VKVAIQTQPQSTATAGQPFATATQPIVVELVDQNGNVETGDNSTVITALLASGTGPLLGTTTATVVGGVATFTNLYDKTAETITLAFTGGGLTSSASAPIMVSPAGASKLVIQIQPYATVVAGNPLTDPIVVAEEDQYGNIETGDNTTQVTASLASGSGNLIGTTQATMKGGIASFNDLQDNTAGALTLQFTAGNLPSAVSNPSLVTPAPASQLSVKRPPGGVIAGDVFPLQVVALDPYGNVATSYNAPVTVGLASGSGGSLGGTTTVAATDGVANFTDLVATQSGAIALTATSGNLTPGSSGPINVAPPPPTPTIVGELVVTTRAKGKKGKPVITGFMLHYSTPMNAVTAGAPGNYTVAATTIKRVKKKKVTTFVRVPFNASYSAATQSVTLTLVGKKQAFAKGGEITVMYSGVTSAAGVALDASDATFTIQPKAKTVTPG
jgi:hypothetical protein